MEHKAVLFETAFFLSENNNEDKLLPIYTIVYRLYTATIVISL